MISSLSTHDSTKPISNWQISAMSTLFSQSKVLFWWKLCLAPTISTERHYEKNGTNERSFLDRVSQQNGWTRVECKRRVEPSDSALQRIEPMARNGCLSSPAQQTPPRAFCKRGGLGERRGDPFIIFNPFFFFSFTRRHGSLFCCYFLSRVNFYRTAAVFHARTKTPYFAQGV